MSDSTCESWREELALRLLGDGSVATPGLLAHLDGCAECREVASEMSETVSMLRLIDPASLEPSASVSVELSERVLGDLRRARQRQRRRAIGAVTLGAAAALAAALVLVVAFANRPVSAPQRTLALRGAPSVSAKAVLVDMTWGTSLQLDERGLPRHEVYTVSMENASGTWWTAGTYWTANDGTVRATMACAVAWDSITGVRVKNAAGATVLTSYAGQSTTPYQ